MGEQARMLRDEILKLFDKPNSNVIKSELKTIQENLKKDTTKEEFANIKAQMTIYGIFIAKLYYGDKDKEDFKFERIVKNIPASNSFLQQLFYTQNNPFYMEKTIKTIIDRSIEMMAETDVVRILDDFAKKNKTSTAIVEFYETFLEKYDPKLRADMGVWYTPQPIVDFMVRQIDLILINVFNIKDGIIDATPMLVDNQKYQSTSGKTANNQQTNNQESNIYAGGSPVQPQVQVLDPATGTGTFLVEYIRLAFEKFVKTGRYSEWNNFVENHLLKSLNAFEIMMCPYVLAHLQIDIILQQFGTNASNFISKYIENNGFLSDENGFSSGSGSNNFSQNLDEKNGCFSSNLEQKNSCFYQNQNNP
jgi:predicted helicase